MLRKLCIPPFQIVMYSEAFFAVDSTSVYTSLSLCPQFITIFHMSLALNIKIQFCCVGLLSSFSLFFLNLVMRKVIAAFVLYLF